MTWPADADLCVLLTPRAVGGHEIALLGWLADAVRSCGLRPLIVAPDAALSQACAEHGLADWLHPASSQLASGATAGARRRLSLRLLRSWPADRPLLLAPGVLHAQAWLTAAAVMLGRKVWVYVPMTYCAKRMGYPVARLRDWLLAPWLRRVHAWITLDQRQADGLRRGWAVLAPVHQLPNLARLPATPPPTPRSAGAAPLRVAFVGRFDAHQKGLDWLASTLQQRSDWLGRYSWRFQGWGQAEAALQALAARLAPGQVQVHGRAPLDDALAASDVLLLASRYEGVPLVALEATLRGWPVVASRSSGLADLLPSSSLFDLGDSDGLAKALDSLATAQARAQAVAHAQRQYDAAGRADRYRQALQRLVQALQNDRLAMAGLCP